jgi:uncharacterized protein (TIRG00374 family)
MTKTRFHGRRFWLQMTVSVVIFAALLSFVGLGGVRQSVAKFDWHYGPWFGLVATAFIAAFALRWYLLLGRETSFCNALTATTIGLGGNMVLPARGGDVLRVVLSARETKVGAHLAVSALVIEKAIDLIVVAAVGFVAIALHAGDGGSRAARTTASVAALAVITVALVGLWSARRGTLIFVFRRIFRVVRIGPSIYRHAYGTLDRLARAIHAQALVLPMFLSALLWCGLYPLSYALIGQMVGIPVGYLESLILVFAGALGLALPAAPSGLGTFHASILSGFVLLGRDSTEGLVLAVAIHAIHFITLLLPGAIAYFALLLWKSRQRFWETGR